MRTATQKDTITKPIHSGLKPQALNFIEISASHKQALEPILQDLLCDSITVCSVYKHYTSQASMSELPGMYRIEVNQFGTQAGKKWFVKITSTSRAKREWAFSQSFPKNFANNETLLVGSPRAYCELSGIAAVAYSWLDIRFFDAARDDVGMLGRQLAHLHSVLQRSSLNSTMIASQSLPLSFDQLSETASALEIYGRQHRLDCSHLKPKLDELESSRSDLNFFWNLEAQLVHHDLNLGNIVVSDKNVIFIDFEETTSCLASPLVDISTILERVFIVDRLSSDLIRKFLSGYKNQTLNNKVGMYLSLDKIAIFTMISEYRSWLALDRIYKNGLLKNGLLKGEVEKFTSLLKP